MRRLLFLLAFCAALHAQVSVAPTRPMQTLYSAIPTSGYSNQYFQITDCTTSACSAGTGNPATGTAMLAQFNYAGTGWTLVGGSSGSAPCTSTADSIQYGVNSTTLGCAPMTFSSSTITLTSGNVADLSAGNLKLPEASGFTSTSTNTIGIDTAANQFHFWNNSLDLSPWYFIPTTTPTVGGLLSVSTVHGGTNSSVSWSTSGSGNATLQATNSSAILDASSAGHTMPTKAGLTSALPATCTVSEQYFATDATAGQNIYQCTATNTWTQTGVIKGFTASPQTTTYTMTTADFTSPGCKILTTASASFTVTLPVSTSMPAVGTCAEILNYGTGYVTVLPNGQLVNGVPQNAPTLGPAITAQVAPGSHTAVLPVALFIVPDSTGVNFLTYSSGSGPTSLTGLASGVCFGLYCAADSGGGQVWFVAASNGTAAPFGNQKTYFGGNGTNGVLQNYDGQATVENGMPAEFGHINLITQSAAISTGTALYTPASSNCPTACMVRVSYDAKVTTADTSGSPGSILGGTTGFQLAFQDGTDSVAQNVTLPEFSQAGAALTIATGNTGNSTTTKVMGSTMVWVKTGVAMTYGFGYATNGTGGTAMVYELHVRLEVL